MKILRRIVSIFVSLVAPEKGSLRAYRELSATALERLFRAAAPAPHHFLHALFSYADPQVREIVWEIKYRRHSLLAEKIGELLCEKMVVEIRNRSISAEKIILAPVSSSATRRRERGFNQCEVLCEAILKRAPVNFFQYEPGLLTKIKHTLHQADLPRAERLKNIVGSYAVSDPEMCRGKIVCVVDDVITTGATLCEIRRALMRADAREVHGFAIAH